MTPILYPTNYLELGTPSTSNDAAGFPKERCYDRDIGLRWKAGGTGNSFVRASPSAGTPTFATDTCIIAATHNLAGIGCQYESSPDGSAWTSRANTTPSDSSLVRLTLSPLTFAHWRLLMLATVVASEIPEVCFTKGVALPRAPLLRGQRVGVEGNVLDQESYGGHVWALVRGERRWTATYPYQALTMAERETLLAAHLAVDEGARHFYLLDAEGVVRWVEWLDRVLEFAPVKVNAWDVTLHFREVLGAAA